MPRLTETYRRGRQEEIADAAVRVVERHGLGAASMTEIIAESGLSAGAVYGHFAGKREIFLYAVRRLLDARRAALAHFHELCLDRERAGEAFTPRGLLTLFLDALAGVLTERPTTLHLHLYSEALVDPEFAGVVREMAVAMEQFFADHLYRGGRGSGLDHDQASDLARELVPVMVTVVQGYVQRAAFDPGGDPGLARRRLARTVPDRYLPPDEL
jgi:TetR/AcrR family transcriptional regulator, transcriptional repressor of aconitase